LPGAEFLVGNRLDQALAGLAVGARQGDQVLHRRVRDDLAAQHAFLDRSRQISHQAESQAHPAQASIESSRELIEGQ
jgi:hypothetical protein